MHLENAFLQVHTLAGTRVVTLAAIWMVLTNYYFVRTFVQRPVGREIYLGSVFILLVAVLAALDVWPRDAYSTDGVL